ncbi:MAG TPA: phosphate/phosphite/phosphonate ABC transporter substrate-binding protein [Thiobacillus sp.]
MTLITATMVSWVAASETPTLKFGIPPQQSPTELTKRWTPILQYLSKQSGLILELKTAKDIPTFHQQIMEGHFDIVFVNPNTYVAANKVIGYQAFAKEKNGKSQSFIVVRKDGGIHHLSQLNGQTMAFPSHTAFMATILPLKQLEDNKVPVKIQYVVSIDSVYRSVAKGLFVAGGGESRTFGALDPAIRDQLTLLWQSDELPAFPFFAHPRVKPEILEKLQKAMLEIGQTSQGSELLKAVNIKALDQASDAEYDAIRKLNLPLEVK